MVDMCSSEVFRQSMIPYYVCGHRSKWPMRFGKISWHLGVLGDGFEGKYWYEHDTPDMGRRGQWQGFCQFYIVNTLTPSQNGRRFADDTFKRIFLNENIWISLKKSLKFVPKVLINNIPSVVQIMAWRWPGDKPLFEPMMDSLLTHICVSRPQWFR